MTNKVKGENNGEEKEKRQPRHEPQNHRLGHRHSEPDPCSNRFNRKADRIRQRGGKPPQRPYNNQNSRHCQYKNLKEETV